LVPTLLAAAAATTTTTTAATATTSSATNSSANNHHSHAHLIHPSQMTGNSSCNLSTDPSSSPTLATLSSQHHPYAFTTMPTTTNLSGSSANLVVDSTSHLSTILNLPPSSSSSSSPSIVPIEPTTTNSNPTTNQPLSPNEQVG
jgi:peptidoglycan DL-endopeptidase CwlO